MEDVEIKQIVTTTSNYIKEAREAKHDRMEKNKRNFDVYNLKQDYSHKRPGQSREFLPKQAMSIEQICTFFQQGIIDFHDWFSVSPSPGIKDPLFSENEIVLLLSDQLEKANFFTFFGDCIKEGLLASLMIAKVHGHFCKRPMFYTQEYIDSNNKIKKTLKKEDREYWRLKLDLVRPEDYFPDPNSNQGGRKLYECQNIWLDMAEVYRMCEGPHKIYDMKQVEKLARCLSEDEDQKIKKSKETGQNTTFSNYRGRIKITECWGDIIEQTTGKLLHENVKWTVANDLFLIEGPKKNPFWHGESPFVVSPVIRTPHSVWHKALMDSPTQINIAMNELFNLIVDAGMMSTHGIKQVRTDWLEDLTEIENGIYPGQTLRASTQCPPGMKVIERVDTSSMSNESLAVLNTINGEFGVAALTNDLRMGVLPSRAVKATEVVEASQTITSVFNGVAKNIEKAFIEKLLAKSWLTCLQNFDDLDSEDTKDLIGEKRALEVSSVSPEDRFAKSALGHKFQCYGISNLLSKAKDFRKLTALLQTISGSDLLIQEFMKQYDMSKFIAEIIKALDINTDKIKISEEEKAVIAMSQQMAQQAPMAGTMGPNMQSQIPQASGGPAESNDVRGMIPQTNFPRASGGL